MGKKLIITEKPSVARDFARVLKVSGNQKGYIENGEYVISWCVGHLVGLEYPEVYDAKYGTWRLEDLPFLPETYKYGVLKPTKDQYDIVEKLLHREDIDVVYWAGDSGKEGQTIEENIRNFGGVRDGMTELRVWIDSQTDDEMLKGIREAKPMSDYELLGRSGIMRTIEDYSLGINFSRALSVRYGKMINDAAATKNYTAIAIGRVMTCVLGMVVNREREIRNFVETPFYRVIGTFGDAGLAAEWKTVSGSKYFESPLLYKENGFKKEEDAKTLIGELQGLQAVVEVAETSTSKKNAPLLFNLAELQSECSKRFKISPNETLQIAQDLYERKLTTYPRTDARVLTTAVAKEIHKNIGGLKHYEPVAPFAEEILKNGKHVGIEKTSYTDDSKVTDHYAIIPTGQLGALSQLDSLHQKVFELIVRRFLAIFYPPAEYLVMKVEIVVGKEHFFTGGKILMEPGYMKISGIPSSKDSENGDEDSDSASGKTELLEWIKTIKKGDEVSVQGYEIKEGKTSPPKRYTSGNLILAMENAGKLIEDEELREQIRKSGIGTSATRGEILDKLVRIKYLNQNPKNQIISPENLGEMIYEIVALSIPSLLNPEMTANWEKGLEGITNGTVDDREYRQKLEDFIRRETMKMVTQDRTKEIALRIHPFTGKESKGIATKKPLGIKCPRCGGELTTTSFGYGCSNYSKEGDSCKFSLGKVAGKDIPEEVFAKLIESGKTPVLDGFSGKNKKPFSAALMLKENEQGEIDVVFDFSQVQPEYLEGAACPACGGRLEITSYGYSCENRRNAERPCYFGIGEICGHHVTKEEVGELLASGTTQVIKGFKSKAKNTFAAKLKLAANEEGRLDISFDFEGIEPDSVPEVKCPNCGSKIYIKGKAFSCSSYDASNPDSCHFYIGKIAGKDITLAQVQELLKDGKTSTIRGFKGRSGKKFDACLLLKKREDGTSEIAFDFEHVEAKVIGGVSCPICGGDIVKTPFGFGCSKYDKQDPEHSCRFSIGTFSGVKITEKQIKELLTDGITSEIAGFKSKSGNTFSAQIALNRDEEGIVKGCKFVFPQEDELLPDLKCPGCSSEIMKTRFGYRCKNYVREGDGCHFAIGTIAGLVLPLEQFTKLITEKKTDWLTGFTSKEGKNFEASLILDENLRAVFQFDRPAENAEQKGTENA